MSASYQGELRTPERMERAKAMRAGGASWGRIVAATGLSMYVLKCEMIPGFQQKERQKTLDRRTGMRTGMPTRRRRLIVGSDLSQAGHRVHDAIIIPYSVLRERDEVTKKPLTLSQLLFGDPLPGRSALDKKKQQTEIQKVFG